MSLHEKVGLSNPGRPAILDGVRNGAWLDSQEFPDLSYHLPGIIPEGFTLLAGAPKIGKSWFVLALALATASGGRALGFKVEPRPTLYLALEDGDRRLQDRCRKLLMGEPIPPGFEYITHVEPGQVVPLIEGWQEFNQDHAPLTILDTLGKVMPPALQGETTYSRDYRIGSVLHGLAESVRGSAIVTNHHDRKAGSDDFVERVSGTNGLAGAADTIVVVSRDRGRPEGIVAVTGRDVIEGEYAVTFDGGRGMWTLDGGSLEQAAEAAHQRRTEFGLDERSRSIVNFVNANPEGVRSPEIADALDIEPNTARAYLSRLYETGRIEKIARGLYGPVASVASVALDSGNATDATHATHPLGEPDTGLWEGES